MKIYAGNLDYQVTEDELRTEFSAFGKVDSVAMITDRDTGRSKGFAFIEMPSVQEGQAAITGMNGKALKERTLIVNAARPRTEEGRGGGSYGGKKDSFNKNRGRRY
jgi:cold-inducible RNA-binding protein